METDKTETPIGGSHMETDKSETPITGSHIETDKTEMPNAGSHMETDKTEVPITGSHIETDKTETSNTGNHMEMDKTETCNTGSHMETDKTETSNTVNHMELDNTETSNTGSNMETDKTEESLNKASHMETVKTEETPNIVSHMETEKVTENSLEEHKKELTSDTPVNDTIPSGSDLPDTVELPIKAPIQCTEGPDEGISMETVTKETVTKETVTFKVIYNKQKFDVTFPLDDPVSSMKSHIETLTKVPSSMQKVMFKGKMRDEETLRSHGIIKGSKVMLIGSTVTDVMSVSAPDPKTLKEIEKQTAATSKEPLCKQKPHKTVLEKHGKPDDVMIGVKKHKEPLPPVPLTGMYNKSGGKVRLTFKLEQDQLWIGTKERTEKISMGSIKAVVSEAIEGHEGYHMMGIQLGPTEASRYWVYWVPAQYVDAIKDAVLGKWQTELY